MRKIVFVVLMFLFGIYGITLVYAAEEVLPAELKWHTEDCETSDIAVAQNYLEKNYQAIITEALVDYTEWQGMNFTAEDIENLTLGSPFLEYNVDGEQLAVLYFPLYNGNEAVGLITLVHKRGSWTRYYDCNPGDLYAVWKLLDAVDYENTDTIVYTINNRCYVENCDKGMSMRIAYMENGDDVNYSAEESAFMKMSWSEKKKLVEEGNKNLLPYSRTSWNCDDDRSKYVTYTGGEPMDLQIEEIQDEEKMQNIKLVLLVVGVVVLITVASTAIILGSKRKNKSPGTR